jgi:hypothetical protein
MLNMPSSRPDPRLKKRAAPHRAAKRPRKGGSLSGILGIKDSHLQAVLEAAEQSGLLKGKGGRIAGRVSPTLIAQAKKRTGIQTDTDLLVFALANLALEDKFPEAFKDARGSVDPELKLGF